MRRDESSLDRVLLSTDCVRVGAFACSPRDRRFRDTGPIEQHLVAFPRTGVWIRHAGAAPFVADPRIATIYNRGQEYTRAAVSAIGDRSDWFAVSPPIAQAIAAEFDVAAVDRPDRPFARSRTMCAPKLYLRQRALFHAIERGDLDVLEAEEAVMSVVMSAIAASHDVRLSPPAKDSDARADLVERAKADIVAHIGQRTTLGAMARRLDASPFALCRAFRAVTNTSLHQYRLDVRMHMALAPLASADDTVSRIAADLGFTDHSHLTASFRRRLALTPTTVRAMIRGEYQ